MNGEKIGQFILTLRKSQQMTQKELAAKLYITDKAVSKWERGLSCPDIALLPDLSAIFGVTVSELLNGERNGEVVENPETAKGVGNALKYARNQWSGKVKSMRRIFMAAFSICMLLGIVTCAICDLAITGTLTWSLISISSIVFAWLVLLPIVQYNLKGVAYSLTIFSLLLIPYLYGLDVFIQAGGALMPIGARMSLVLIVFLWIIFWLNKALAPRWLLATAIELLLGIVASFVVNIILHTLIQEPLLDVWDIQTFFLVASLSGFLFSLDIKKRRQSKMV